MKTKRHRYASRRGWGPYLVHIMFRYEISQEVRFRTEADAQAFAVEYKQPHRTAVYVGATR